jgi:methyl-accepting chemotaxis protein
VTQLSQIVRQTSATAQESAAASTEMNSQAETLEGLAAMFKL